MPCGCIGAVVEDDVEAAGECYDEFLVFTIGVPSAVFSSGYVVDPVGALDLEGYLFEFFDEGEVASAVEEFGEVDYGGFVHGRVYIIYGVGSGGEGLDVEGGDGDGGAAELVEADEDAGCGWVGGVYGVVGGGGGGGGVSGGGVVGGGGG